VSDDIPFQLPPVTPGSADLPPDAVSPELLASLLADGDDELAAWVLQRALEEQSRAEVFDGILRDAMRLVGERWSTGQWSIAEEHLASRTLVRALELIRPQPGPESRIGPVAVLAGVAGEQHVIGLLCLEQALVDQGWTVANLGADMPAADLAGFVRRNDTALVALSCALRDRVGDLASSITALRAAADGRAIPILVGGMLAQVPGIAATVGADGAAQSIGEAVAFAEAHRPSD
jgi:methanogenic corrinoid protein MtbC1